MIPFGSIWVFLKLFLNSGRISLKNSIIGNQRSLVRAQNIQDYVSATVYHTHHFGYDPSASDDNSLKKVGDKSKMHF